MNKGEKMVWAVVFGRAVAREAKADMETHAPDAARRACAVIKTMRSLRSKGLDDWEAEAMLEEMTDGH